MGESLSWMDSISGISHRYVCLNADLCSSLHWKDSSLYMEQSLFAIISK